MGARAALVVPAALALLAATAAGGRAQAPARRFTVDTVTSSVRFEGHATLGAFTATTNSMSGWAELADPGHLTSGRGAVAVRAATLKTGIGLRDRHLRGELDTDHYPLITLSVERVLPGADGAAGGDPVVLEGALSVRGTPHAVRLGASAAVHGDTLVVAGSTPMRFTELGMKPPTRMLGTTRVRDEFVLGYDVRFVPAGP
jgi:polyisoprenoid-binding protein YceI